MRIMRVMRTTELDLLLLLVRKGALRKSVKVTTIDIARELDLSQQSVSRWLLELEREDELVRSRKGVKLTTKAVDQLKKVNASLTAAFEKSKNLVIEGEVVEGFKESSYYISRDGYKSQFVKKLGFEPFPGTLNLKLKTIDDIEQRQKLTNGIRIDSFESEGRTFGGATCFTAILNDKERVFIIDPDRTHYGDNIVQLISPINLRKKLKIKKGDSLTLETVD